MNLPGARAAIDETPAGLTIEMGPVRHWAVAPTALGFLVAWGWIENESLRFLADARMLEGARGLVLSTVALFALVLWSYAGWLTVREGVWMTLAIETVSVGAGALRVRREAPIFRTAHEFPLAEVRDLHLDGASGHLAFQAKGRTWTFGRTLLPEEAERVFARIGERFAPIVRSEEVADALPVTIRGTAAR